MFLKIKGRMRLASFRWKRINRITKVLFLGTPLALLTLGSFTPLPNSPLGVLIWIIACLFLGGIYALVVSSFRRQVKRINSTYKKELNSIRRPYGLKER